MTYPENPPYTGGPDEVVPTGGLSATGIAALAAISAQDWEDELYGAADTFLTPISELLGKLFDLFAEFVDLDGFIEIASEVLGFFYNLLDRAGFFDLLSGGVDLFGWLVELGVDAIEALIKPIVEVLKWAWELITGLIDVEGFQAFIERIVDALSPLFSATGFADLFTKVIQFFLNIFGGSIPNLPISLDDLVGKIPLVSTLVSIITGKPQNGDVDLGLGELGAWARKVEKDAKGSFDAIEELGRRLLGGAFQAPPNGGADVNVLSQGDFATLETIEAADGWSWDNTTTASGSGGSAKLVASGSAQRLYSKQSIPVVAGDVLTVAGKVKSSGFNAGTGREMALSLVPWVGTSRVQVGGVNQNVVFTPRTTNTTNWFSMGGTYTIPSGVTSVQVRLAVTANSGATVWFDDISVKKKSELDQGYVNNLVQAWRDIYLGATGEAASVFWDAVGLAISGVRNLGTTANGAIAVDRGILFGDTDGGETVIFDALPTEDLLPSSGSGAVLVRTTASPVVATSGRNPVDSGFYNVLEVTPSADVEVVTSSGSYVGAYRALSKGWYLITLGFGGRRITSSGWSLAPLLYKGKTLTLGTGPTSLKPYKVGSEVWATSGAWTRYCQGTFSVFLDAGDYVKAGYDVIYGPLTNTNDPVIDADTTGVENYFTIALLSKVSDNA